MSSPGTRQDQRARAEDGTKEDLQSAVAADVVERAPDDVGLSAAALGAIAPVRPARVWTTILGLPEVPEVSMTHSVATAFARLRARPARAASRSGNTGRSRSANSAGSRSVTIAVDVRVVNQGLQVLGPKIGRAEHDPPRNPVESRSGPGRRSTARPSPAAPLRPASSGNRPAEAGAAWLIVGKRDAGP